MPCQFSQLWDNTEKQALLANKSPVPTGQPLATVRGTGSIQTAKPFRLSCICFLRPVFMILNENQVVFLAKVAGRDIRMGKESL